MPSLRDLMMENEQQKLGREMSYQPFYSPIPQGVVDYAREVGGRIANPANTLRGVIDRMKSQPADEMAMDWANPVAGGLVGMFAGKGAKTANLAMLARAEELAKKGVPDPQIWKETGWTLNTPDKMPRFEISDDMAEYVGLSRKSPKTVESAIEHQNLYEGYPLSRKLRLVETKTPNEGSYTEAFGLEVGTGNRKSTTLHELQHAIQQREGFARGGSPEQMWEETAKAIESRGIKAHNALERAKASGGIDPETGMTLDALQSNVDELWNRYQQAKNVPSDPYEAYQRLAGEAEARLTQARMAMTPEQRLAQYPYEPEYFQQATGVPLSDLIVRKEGGKAMNVSDQPYWMGHRPTETGATADNITQEVSDMGFPKDFYDNPHFYENVRDPSVKESIDVLKSIRNNPDATVTIYRAGPKNEFNYGDWVSLSKKYAHGEALQEGVKVHALKVKAKDIQFAGDSVNEFGYYPK